MRARMKVEQQNGFLHLAQLENVGNDKVKYDKNWCNSRNKVPISEEVSKCIEKLKKGTKAYFEVFENYMTIDVTKAVNGQI